MNSREETLVELLERRFVDADGYIKWDDQVKGLIATHQFRSPDMAFCHCSNDEKHGQTSVMCCNHCGLPDEEFWKRPEPPDMAEALREIRNRLYDSLPTGEIDANASWEMLQSIKRHVGELDNFCASLSSPN